MNIPTVEVNELRLDNLFELADGSIVIMQYKSDYDKQDKIKYLSCITGIANRQQQDKKECSIIHMIIIYTGDIGRKQVCDKYNIGIVKMKRKITILSELDSKGVFNQLREKVEKRQMLSDEKLVEFKGYYLDSTVTIECVNL